MIKLGRTKLFFNHLSRPSKFPYKNDVLKMLKKNIYSLRKIDFSILPTMTKLSYF